MTWRTERSAVTAVLTGLVGGLLILSFGLSPVARMAPLAVGAPTFCLLCLELTSDLFRTDPAPGLEISGTGDRLGSPRVFAWLGFLVAGAFLAGLAGGLSIFVFAFLRVRSSERWSVALSYAAGMWLVLDVGIERLLRINLYDGFLSGWIG
jgi:hypothetical protein